MYNGYAKEHQINFLLNFRKYISFKKAVYFILILTFILFIWFYLSLPDIEYLKNSNPKVTAMMELRLEQAENKNKKYRIKQEWVSFNQIPELLKKSVRITEDAGFYKHDGIDWDEVEESIKKNISEWEFSRGGSTITQQLAKNLYLSTKKSLFRKFHEFFITKRIEAAVSKNRIFHIYLNIIEFGPGIFGVQAASKYYFGKDVSDLSLTEIVRLTAVIPQPLSIKASSSNKWLKWKCRWILKKLKKYKYIDQFQYDRAITTFN